MPTLVFRIDAELDGSPLSQLGFPFVLLRQVEEFQAFRFSKPADPNDQTFTALPVGELTTVSDLIIRAATKALGVRIEGGETGSIALRMNANSLLLAVNCAITATNVTANNDGSVDTSDAQLLGLGAGT